MPDRLRAAVGAVVTVVRRLYDKALAARDWVGYRWQLERHHGALIDERNALLEQVGDLTAEVAQQDAALAEVRAESAGRLRDVLDLRIGKGDWAHMIGILRRDVEEWREAHAALHGTDESSCLPVNIPRRCMRVMASLKADLGRARAERDGEVSKLIAQRDVASRRAEKAELALVELRAELASLKARQELPMVASPRGPK